MTAEAHDSNSDPTDPTEPLLHSLLFETSPWGNVDAIVQHDERVVYFYLNGPEPFGTRACWVRNLEPGPWVIDQADLEKGLPPLMPRTHCRTSTSMPVPTANRLQIVWFEEGNAAALLEDETVIAVIPPWSGVDGFHGYSSECVSENQLVWPLIGNPELFKRIEKAAEFWLACSSEREHPYAGLQPLLLDAYRKRFGKEEQYYSIDGGHFPPRGAVLFRSDNVMTLVSVGMSFRPQPNVEMAVEHPRAHRRIELMVSFQSDHTPAGFQKLIEQFSGLAAYPWNQFTWFGAGHSCQFDALAHIIGSENGTFRFHVDRDTGIDMPMFRGDPIQLLRLEQTA